MVEPSAAGKRFIASTDGPALSHLDVARTPREKSGDLGASAPMREARLVRRWPRPAIHNNRARTELGWRPRPATRSILDTAESVRDLRLLEPESA
ncbi:hypothetical protein [Nocardia rhamnosiphila]|uniref:NAD(P)-binding domain-containing protein n=1 Tax=Nocardia rhamnosiphila TaxID=426716 RepID=A0ABV2WYS9_9NOCA